MEFQEHIFPETFRVCFSKIVTPESSRLQLDLKNLELNDWLLHGETGLDLCLSDKVRFNATFTSSRMKNSLGFLKTFACFISNIV